MPGLTSLPQPSALLGAAPAFTASVIERIALRALSHPRSAIIPSHHRRRVTQRGLGPDRGEVPPTGVNIDAAPAPRGGSGRCDANANATGDGRPLPRWA